MRESVSRENSERVAGIDNLLPVGKCFYFATVKRIIFVEIVLFLFLFHYENVDGRIKKLFLRHFVLNKAERGLKSLLSPSLEYASVRS